MPRARTPEQLAYHREYMKRHRGIHKEKALAVEKQRRDARTPEQKANAAAYAREWRKRNAEKCRADDRAQYEKLKVDPDRLAKERARLLAQTRKLADEVIAHYGGRCACCGETERMFLSIDHINNDGAEHRRQINPKAAANGKGVNLYGWLKKNGYPEGFQVLCMNCNHGKARNGGVCPHQAGKFSELSKSANQTKPVPPT